MTIRSLYHLIAIFIVFSCATSTRESDTDSGEPNPQQQEISDLEDRVIAIHDEVMPLMGTLVSLKDQLESKNAELETTGETAAKDQVIINSMVLENLDQAHESMMDWMRNFEPADPDSDPEASLNYLREELQKISSIKELTNNAISAAEEALGTGE